MIRSQGVDVVASNGRLVAPVEMATDCSGLDAAVYATEKSRFVGVAIIGICVQSLVVIWSVSVRLSTRPQVSVARIENVETPSVVGVPEIVAPLPACTNVSPAGSAPETSAQFTLPPPNGLELHAPDAENAC